MFNRQRLRRLPLEIQLEVETLISDLRGEGRVPLRHGDEADVGAVGVAGLDGGFTADAFSATMSAMDLAAFRASLTHSSPPLESEPGLARLMARGARRLGRRARLRAGRRGRGRGLGARLSPSQGRRTRETPPIGTAAPASRSAELPSTTNGRRSRARCCRPGARRSSRASWVEIDPRTTRILTDNRGPSGRGLHRSSLGAVPESAFRVRRLAFGLGSP